MIIEEEKKNKDKYWLEWKRYEKYWIYLGGIGFNSRWEKVVFLVPLTERNEWFGRAIVLQMWETICNYVFHKGGSENTW